MRLLRPLLLGLLAFLIIGSYELARPAAESLFLRDHGSQRLPWVWLAVAATAAVAVHIYQPLARRTPILRLLALVAFTAALCFGALTFFEAASWATFALYVLKDIYVVMLVECFWSYANLTSESTTARWTYGFYCFAGSLGGTLTGLITVPVARDYGTRSVLWLLIPWLLVVAVACRVASRWADRPPPPAKPGLILAEGWAVLAKSRYLVLLLILIAVVQVSITLVDFGYNRALEASYPDPDQRTGVIGQIYSATNGAAMVLQLLTGPLLKLLGVPLTLTLVPALLATSLVAHALHPRFIFLAFTKVASKALDYSLFRASKEMLYIPLSYAEKTQGKALVDVLTYRVAKGLAAALLLLPWWQDGRWLLLTLLLLLTIWILLVRPLGKRFRALQNSNS